MSGSVDVDAVAARCRDLVVEELLRDSRLRREILLAIAREAATREDVRMLREELGREIRMVREDLARVEKELKGEIAHVEKELRAEIARVEKELRGEIARVEKELRGEIARVERGLGERLARVDGQLNLFVKLFIAFNAPALVGTTGILLKMVFG